MHPVCLYPSPIINKNLSHLLSRWFCFVLVYFARNLMSLVCFLCVCLFLYGFVRVMMSVYALVYKNSRFLNDFPASVNTLCLLFGFLKKESRWQKKKHALHFLSRHDSSLNSLWETMSSVSPLLYLCKYNYTLSYRLLFIGCKRLSVSASVGFSFFKPCQTGQTGQTGF